MALASPSQAPPVPAWDAGLASGHVNSPMTTTTTTPSTVAVAKNTTVTTTSSCSHTDSTRPEVVFPLPTFDGSVLWHSIVLLTTFLFPCALDPERLRSSLDALCRRDGWRKLSARLRRGAGGRFEYRIPATYTAASPALSFSCDAQFYDVLIADHPLASKMPRDGGAAAKPEVVLDPDIFFDLQLPPDAPRKPAEYLTRDVPQLGMHVVRFRDATIVTFSFPHSLHDLMGFRAVVDAWLLILRGREDEIVPPLGVYDDPLGDRLGVDPDAEPHKLADRRLGMLKLAAFGLNNIGDFALRNLVSRVVRVPARLLDSLRKQAIDELASATGVVDLFISEADVLLAWWQRVATLHLPARDAGRTISIINVMSIRRAVTDLLPPPPGTKEAPFISNALALIPALTTLGQVRTENIGQRARRMRKALAELGTRQQVEAVMGITRNSMGRLPPLFGDWSMHNILFSNWSKASFFHLDLGPAAVYEEDKARGTRPVYMQTTQPSIKAPHNFIILGKDDAGNTWLSGYMTSAQWAAMEAQLNKDEGIMD